MPRSSFNAVVIGEITDGKLTVNVSGRYKASRDREKIKEIAKSIPVDVKKLTLRGACLNVKRALQDKLGKKTKVFLEAA